MFGLFKLGKFIRMVPHSVMLGFVNGLAVVIFLAQFSHFKMSDGVGGATWMQGIDLGLMLALVVLTMVIIYLAPKITTAIPAPLLAIGVVSLLVIFFYMPK